ncbi:MAG: TIGR02996 domain-containing protein [Planctomycetes bacterium]|nr:TIGR02996 domain-containing protein [Planctomycetota bacterium]
MSDRDALFAAIVAHPDDDTPRLMYADWLDEHAPDATPSPAAGPSARAEYIRAQCRLARHPYDDPDYPELRERQRDLAEWLKAHTDSEDERPDVPAAFDWFGSFDGIPDRLGDSHTYDRGFPWLIEFTEWEDEGEKNVKTITKHLPAAHARSTARALALENAYGTEIADVLKHPSAAGLRGLTVLEPEDDDDVAIRAIAASEHLAHLRHLSLEMPVERDDLRRLAKATGLGALESLTLDYPVSADLRELGAARWFRDLRALHLWMDDRDGLKSLADLPPMPNLVALSVSGSGAPTATAVRRFAASASFPRLARLELVNVPLGAAHTALLAEGTWPLRHLLLDEVRVEKGGAEALAGAAFAKTLRVLELPSCGITAGGVAALAGSAQLSGLRHLDLHGNAVGPGGLLALSRATFLPELRALGLSACNQPRAPLDAATVLEFVTALDSPELRHLTLNLLPVCVRGARALVANPALANLTRLSLSRCALRDAGARALVESGAFPNLSALDLSDNGAGGGLAKLAHPATFPRLGTADLTVNRVPKSTARRLAKRPGVSV